jgi:uncharacterized protein YdeI (YjbR/CyaY-like superfamily)
MNSNFALCGPRVRWLAMDARVDAYIAKSAPFAQPILNHIRDMVHAALPDIEESIKWSMPFFVTKKGKIIANMAAFKAHCSFGVWSSSARKELEDAGFESEGSMGTLGRLTTVKDLPSQKVMTRLLKQAAIAVEAGESLMKRGSAKKSAKSDIEMPAGFAAALKKNKAAQKQYANFSPSAQREYLEWITEAKREETRDKRIVQAVEQIAEGKTRLWKYAPK